MKIQKFLFKNQYFKLTISLLFTIVGSFNGVLLSSIVNFAGKFTVHTSTSTLVKFGVYSIVLWAVIYIGQTISNITQASIVKHANTKLKSTVLKKKWYECNYNSDSAQVLALLTGELKLLEENYFYEIFDVISNILIFLVSLTYMLYINFLVSLIFILFSILPLIVPLVFSRTLGVATEKWTIQNEKTISVLKDFFQGINVFRTYGTKEKGFRFIRTNIINLENNLFHLNLVHFFVQLSGMLIAGLSFVLPFIIGCIVMRSSGRFSITTLIALFLANDKIISPIMNIIGSFNKIIGTRSIREKLSEIMNIDNEFFDRRYPVKYSEKVIYKVKHVRYWFDNSKKLDISFDIQWNDKILILGESGIGKTTLFKLISGLIPLKEGEFYLLDGKTRYDYPVENVAYISQTPYIFRGSLKDNLSVFDTEVTVEKIKEVLDIVGLASTFDVDRIDTIFFEENGKNLSGGQKQRLELGRALLSDRTLLLADEITSNLDKVSSEKIRNILFSINKPVVEIAHHYDLEEKRYTKIYRINKIGELELIKDNRYEKR